MRRAERRGVILLETMVALAILSSAIVVLVGLARAGADSDARVAQEERLTADADRLLTALTLLTAPEFDQRLGRRQLGPYVVEIQRPEPGLYRVSLSSVDAPAVELLTTVVYREVGSP